MAEPIDRGEITAHDINLAVRRLQKEVAENLNVKGSGAFVSRYEIVGAVARELWELQQAIDIRRLDIFANELLDIAVCCIVGLAGIEAGMTDF